MSDPKNILLIGDTHGNSEHIEWCAARAEAEQADAMFVLGDFGYWEHLDEGWFLDKCAAIVADYGVPLYWLDGNHENHTWLRKRYIDSALVDRDEYGFVIMRKGLMHAPRAHTWTWSGFDFMALGGAYSIDKFGRLRGEDRRRRNANAVLAAVEQGQIARMTPSTLWEATSGEPILWWPEEEVSEEEVAQALKVDKVDILLTHDKPLFASPDWNRKNDLISMDNQQRIQTVMEHLQPQLLVHGHLHYSYRDEIAIGESADSLDYCEVYGLDCDPMPHDGDGAWWYRPEHSVAMLRLKDDHFDLDHRPSRMSIEEDYNPRG